MRKIQKFIISSLSMNIYKWFQREQLSEQLQVTFYFCFSETKTCLFLGTQHGELYLARVKENDPLDFSDCWILPVHDYYNGHMSKILFSYDKRMLLTCGNDGNIFCFKVNEEVSDKKQQIPTPEQFIYNVC